MLGINFNIGNLVSKILGKPAAPPVESYLFLTRSGMNFVTSDGDTLEYFH